MANNPPPPPSGPPFRPTVQTQQGQPFFPGVSQQFRPVGQGIPFSNMGMPAGQNQFSQPVHQFPQWPGQPGHVAPSQTMPIPPYAQPARPLTPGSSQSQPNVPIRGVGATGIPQSSTYPFGPPSFGQPQPNASAVSQFTMMPQIPAPPASLGGQPWLPAASQSTALVTPVQSSGQQPSSSASSDLAADVPSSSQQSSLDWLEHVSSDGRRYYYNKKEKRSSWEKPLELMTTIERADASTDWKEFTSPEGKKYYYNKVTKESKWRLPEELKLARERAQQTVTHVVQSELNVASQASRAPAAVISVSPSSGSATSLTSSSPVSVMPVVPSGANPSQVVVSGPSAIPVVHSTITSAAGVQPPVVTMTSLPATVSGSTGAPSASDNANTTPSHGFDNLASQGSANSINEPSTQNAEEVKEEISAAGKTNPPLSEQKGPDDNEHSGFPTKQEAKNAFKALLESVNVQSDWTWEQTMREIINDKRYGALKTLGERKQAFNEYLIQRKKIEAEERRLRQKNAREEFRMMLEESEEVTLSMKWSKAVSLFENDDRFKAVERARDREDIFDNYIAELERKEKEKAAEDHRRNVEEYKKFLKSCDFIKVNSQWRKIQDRLEEDERCLRLDKLDRLIIFQDYIRDLEKEEEDLKRMQKEQLRHEERKNRDVFRNLMEEHVSSGLLTAKTRWVEYHLKVKDLPQYCAAAANTSGSKPKHLFEDVIQDLEKQYHDDKSRIKDSLKMDKISVVSTWTFEDFKAAVSTHVGSPPISDVNMKLSYEELIERAKEKEEKEAKKRQRRADDFTKLLHSYKEITPSSVWEECKTLFEESEEYRSIGEESLRRKIFEGYVNHLQEKVEEKERKRHEEKAKKDKEREEKEKRKEKEKDRKEEKEREREKGKERSKKDDKDSENVDDHKEEKKRESDKDRKHWKRHRSSNDNAGSDKDEKEESKKSRSHGSESRKSRKHAHSPESNGESRHKRHRDHRDGSRRNSGHNGTENAELGEDGEIR